ncbi:MAG: helix-turn-helix domain-containing protein [Lachnospiraceae bacterium]|nr:helix-turn-helix domain-containing protein [Lachnospiraceae bacterium]
MDYKDLGRRLKDERKKKNITQEQLAEMVDCSCAHISHIETGNTIPSVEILIAIINKLGISSDAILCDSVDKADHVYKDELNELLMDCSENEVKYIVEMAKENIRIYRKYKAINNEGDTDE